MPLSAIRHPIVALVGLCFPLVSVAQVPDDAVAGGAQRRGYVVSERLLETVMKRWAFELADDIDLDEGEEAEVRETLQKRWVPFFQQHQDRLAPLVERWMQAMIDPEAPAPDDVQSWAGEALEFQELILEQFNRTEEELSELLPPEKTGRLRGQFTQMRMGFGFMNTRLHKWQTGDYDPRHWDRVQTRRAARRERRRERWNKEVREQVARLVTLSDWDQYVRDFVQRFELDAAQTTSANAVLTDVKSRARSYLDAHESEIEQARAGLTPSSTLSEGGKEDARATPDRSTQDSRRRELLEPLERLFAELRERLDGIPTEAQRVRAGETDDDASQQDG